jgi:hypothetical protein
VLTHVARTPEVRLAFPSGACANMAQFRQ